MTYGRAASFGDVRGGQEPNDSRYVCLNSRDQLSEVY